jgi:hypothetical protein
MKSTGFAVMVMLGVSAGAAEPELRVTTAKADDAAEVKVEAGRAVVALRSPSGISRAVVERRAEKWPAAVVLRLHLKGLESFRVENGTTTLSAAASSGEGKLAVRVWKDGDETASIDPKSPWWFEVRALDASGKPVATRPPPGGCFEIALPAEFLKGNPKSITIRWIDFYRN